MRLKGIPFEVCLLLYLLMMRHYILLHLTGLLILIGQQLQAQKTTQFLFLDFIQGTVVMKNGAKTTVPLNYDGSNRKMMFKQGDDLLILTNTESIDTIYIGKRKFFPVGNHFFLERISGEHGTVYINWSLQSKYQGQKGAYGQVSQAANVESINTSYWTNGNYNNESPDVYKLRNNNEYWLERNGKFVKCRNTKTLLRLFPQQEVYIKEYITRNKISFDNVERVLILLDYCLSLTAQ